MSNKMDVYELYFNCVEKGKGDHCVYCWFGPNETCQKRLYQEFKRQVRKMLCPFELGQKVYILKYRANLYYTTELQKGYVYRIKNEGKGWKIYARNENGEYIGLFHPESLGKTVFTYLKDAEAALREDNRRKKRKLQDNAELS